MFSLRCHETSLSAACTSGLRSAPPHRYFDAIKCCWLEPPHTPTHTPTPHPPTFCWLAPWAPICAQAELIRGPWNNNYRSYALHRSTLSELLLEIPSPPSCAKTWKKNQWKSHLLVQVVPVCESPPPPLACWLGVSKKVSVHCSPLFIAQQ